MGHVVLTVLGMVAQMERRFIKERRREGIVRARAEGAYQGGKRRLDREKICAMHVVRHGPAAIAKALGCSRMQVYRIVEDKTAPAPVRASSRSDGRAAASTQRSA